MIRAGRSAIDIEAVARLHGMSVRTAQRRGLFKDPTLPAPVNTSRRRRLYDEEQIAAHAQGRRIPALPAADHDDDLLDNREAAQAWSIDVATWRKYVDDKYAPPRDEVVHGEDHWRRGTVSGYVRPGIRAGAGRPMGARDTRPRRPRGDYQQRLVQVRRMLDRAEGQGSRLTGPMVADELGVHIRRAERLLKDAREGRLD